jgi:Glycosyltransferase family 87
MNRGCVINRNKDTAGRWRKILVMITIAACPVLVSLAYRLVHALSYADSDFFTFWLAGYMNWAGENPYSAEQWLNEHHHFAATWIPNPIFPYPLPLATLLAPLGLLRLDQAYAIWMALTFVLVVIAAFLVLYWWPNDRLKHYVGPVMAGLLLFRPVWITVRDGQLGGLLLFLLALTACLWEDGRWLTGGLAIAFVVLKPTLGLPIASLITIWLLATQRWRAVAGMAASGVCLFLLGLVRDPSWVVEFLSIGRSKLVSTFGYSPSLWGIAGTICRHDGRCSLLIGGLLAAVLIVATALFLIDARARLSPLAVVSLSVVVVVLVTPYIWAYDQVLLVLPILLVICVLVRRGKPYLVGALFFLATDVVAIILLLLANQSGEDVWSGLVPAAVGLAALWSIMAPAAGRTRLSPHSTDTSD